MTNLRTNTIRICFAIGATLAASTAFAQQGGGGGGGGGNGGGAAGDGNNDIIAFFHQDKKGWFGPNCTFGGCKEPEPVFVKDSPCGDQSQRPVYSRRGEVIRLICVPRQAR